MPKAAPSVVSPLQPNDSGSQISTAIDLPPVARGLKLLSRVGLRFAQNALKTDHGFKNWFCRCCGFNSEGNFEK